VNQVYALAADMGSMGFIFAHHVQILCTNPLIDIHTLEAMRTNCAKRYSYTSSACVDPEYSQMDAHVTPLKEAHAYPAQPLDTSILCFGILNYYSALWFLGCAGQESWGSFLELARCYSQRATDGKNPCVMALIGKKLAS